MKKEGKASKWNIIIAGNGRIIGERIIVPLDRHIVIHPGGAGVDQGAGVDEGDIFYTSLFYTGTPRVDDEVPV